MKLNKFKVIEEESEKDKEISKFYSMLGQVSLKVQTYKNIKNFQRQSNLQLFLLYVGLSQHLLSDTFKLLTRKET